MKDHDNFFPDDPEEEKFGNFGFAWKKEKPIRFL
jgi:hypothetical protein